jgi:hypothetical protein
MSIISFAIIAFLLLEIMNVIALYFFPGSKYANSVGVFKAWEESKNDPEIHNLIKYLVNWVAGSKLIFILLLITILLTVDAQDQYLFGITLVISISTFFWRLFPLIRKMDLEDQIEPENYSIILGLMIISVIILFVLATVISKV